MAVILAKTPKKESYGNALMGSIFAFGVAIAFMASVMILYYLGYLSIDITLILTVVSCLIAGLASTKFNVPVQIIMQNNIDHNQLGKVVSVSNVMSQALIPFASLMAGFVISQFSIISLYILCTVGLGIVILIYYKKKTYVQL
jgi:hypothetical protein